MTYFAKLKKRRGFTLVECVVAIFIFALLVSTVLLVVANASSTTQKARSSEEELNTLVQNVVADNSYIKYNNNTSQFMKFVVGNNGSLTDKEMVVSYNEISGYKNYIQCSNPLCNNGNPYSGDSRDFMNGKTTIQFDPATDAYICPICGTSVNAIQLHCDSCEAEGSYKDTSKFTYDVSTGGYTCVACHGGYVHDVNYTNIITKAGADTFNISSMTPNAIRYGNVTWPTAGHYEDVFKWDAGTGPFSVIINYVAPATPSDKGKYVVTVSSSDLSGNISGRLDLPKGYTVETLNTFSGTNANFQTTAGNFNQLTFSDNNYQAKFEFSLENDITHSGFEEDYAAEGGLFKMWFDSSSGTTQFNHNYSN